jgi:hypothetical protein
MKAAQGASSTTDRARLRRKFNDLVVLAERLKIGDVSASQPVLPRVTRSIPPEEKEILRRASTLHGNIFPIWEAELMEPPSSGVKSEGLFR